MTHMHTSSRRGHPVKAGLKTKKIGVVSRLKLVFLVELYPQVHPPIQELQAELSVDDGQGMGEELSPLPDHSQTQLRSLPPGPTGPVLPCTTWIHDAFPPVSSRLPHRQTIVLPLSTIPPGLMDGV